MKKYSDFYIKPVIPQRNEDKILRENVGLTIINHSPYLIFSYRTFNLNIACHSYYKFGCLDKIE